jgi:hypothetical protein
METAADKHLESDGWTLYYSPEGYPYYYNAVTGVSEWALNYAEDVVDGNQHSAPTQQSEIEEEGDGSEEGSDDDEDNDEGDNEEVWNML